MLIYFVWSYSGGFSKMTEMEVVEELFYRMDGNGYFLREEFGDVLVWMKWIRFKGVV
jgi:GTP-dependent phosphoenolpyruvate carboxykinase